MSTSDLLSSNFFVEEIVSHRTKNGKTKFFIKWRSYPESENTWESEEDLIADGLLPELKKYTALNLQSNSTKQRRRQVKSNSIFHTKPGFLTPTGTGHEAEMLRRKQNQRATLNNLHTLAEQEKQDLQALQLPTSTYFLTRSLFLRSLCCVYFTAFLVAFHQNPGLIGDNGLLPAQAYWNRLNASHQTNYPLDGMQASPNLLWLMPSVKVDTALAIFAQLGIGLSAVVCISGRANSLVMCTLWCLYFSIDGVGQQFYSFGWESQLLETGFLAIFATPLLSFAYNGTAVGGWTVVWGYRYGLFLFLFSLQNGLVLC